MSRIAIVGGHGQVARHLLAPAAPPEHDPVALVRREDYRDELEWPRRRGPAARHRAGRRRRPTRRRSPGCDAVVFAAGGGPDGNNERKRTVDLEGSLKSIEGARQAGIDRFVQVSAIGVDDPLPDGHRRGLAGVRRGQARRRRRAARQRPGLDDHPARPAHRRPGHRAGLARPRRGRGDVTRADVAAVLAAVLDEPATVGKQWNLVNGETRSPRRSGPRNTPVTHDT